MPGASSGASSRLFRELARRGRHSPLTARATRLPGRFCARSRVEHTSHCLRVGGRRALAAWRGSVQGAGREARVRAVVRRVREDLGEIERAALVLRVLREWFLGAHRAPDGSGRTLPLQAAHVRLARHAAAARGRALARAWDGWAGVCAALDAGRELAARAAHGHALAMLGAAWGALRWAHARERGAARRGARLLRRQHVATQAEVLLVWYEASSQAHKMRGVGWGVALWRDKGGLVATLVEPNGSNDPTPLPFSFSLFLPFPLTHPLLWSQLPALYRWRGPSTACSSGGAGGRR